MVNGKFKGKNSLRSKASRPDALRFKGSSMSKRKDSKGSEESSKVGTKVSSRLDAFNKWKSRFTKRNSNSKGIF